MLTHAVQPPCVFELVFAPRCGDNVRLLFAKVVGELFGYGLCRKQRAVRIKRDYDLVVCFRRHLC